MCQLCKVLGKVKNCDEPICAFDVTGHLTEKHNWGCVTLMGLRESILEIADYGNYYTFNETFNGHDIIITLYRDMFEQTNVLLVFDNTFLFLSWYKSKGEIEYIHIQERTNSETDEDFIINIIENMNKLIVERKENKI
jgi:hypothetical protein